MKPTAERLDHLIDALNSGDRRRIAALTKDDPELASLHDAARRLRGLREPAAASLSAVAVTPVAPRRPGHPLRALGGIASTILLLIVVGVALSFALANAPGRRAGAPAATATAPPPSQQPTYIPAASPSQPWSAIMQPLTAIKVGGWAALLPTATSDFALDVSIYGIDRELPRPITLGLAHGTCATPIELQSTPWLLQATVTSMRTTFSVERAWLDQPLIAVAWHASHESPLGCADLAVAAARERQPISATPVPAGAIAPLPGLHISGAAQLAPTASGDHALFVSITGPVEEINRGYSGPRLLWHLIQGSCEAIQRPPGTRDVTVLYRVNPGGATPGRQDFTINVKREWATQPLAIAAYGEGGGPLIACGDLPAPTAP